MSDFFDAMQFRHACKKFDPDKEIAAEDFRRILEFGRMSPSSFGMEQWKFVSVQSGEKKQQLRKACWDQPQITDCSHPVIILARVADVKPGTEYVKRLFKRRGLDDDATRAYLQKYADYEQSEILPYMNTFAWSSKQCYIALANMMTGAASMGIDSCPIEGFSRTAVDEMLGLDTNQYQTAVVVTFGYRGWEQPQHYRQDLADIIETI